MEGVAGFNTTPHHAMFIDLNSYTTEKTLFKRGKQGFDRTVIAELYNTAIIILVLCYFDGF